MKLGIIQPYIYPYLGYFQLINAVDKFVVYDDVNYIKKGWINRNNLLINGTSNLFTIPLKSISQNKKINEIEIVNEDSWKINLLKTIEQNYKKAPFFDSIFPLLRESILVDKKNISSYVVAQLKGICNYLEISTEIVESSTIYNNVELSSQSRIIDICKIEGAMSYINPIGGIELYNNDVFQQSSIKLNFIKSKLSFYQQFNNVFVPGLSIIDVLMFNSKESVVQLLNEYELISNG